MPKRTASNEIAPASIHNIFPFIKKKTAFSLANWKKQSHPSCADPGIFVRGSCPGQSNKKKSSDNVFFLVNFKDNLSFFKVPEGVQHFSGGSNFFQGGGGGSNCLFPIETHITCDFPGGGGGRTSPPPPLDPHLSINYSAIT